MSRFDSAKAIADTVLYEGYLLYPYRASATKNQARWQFGVLMPPGYADPDIGEYADCRSECLLEAPPTAVLDICLRFLRLQARTAYDASGAAVAALRVGDREVLSWDEAVEEEVSHRTAIGALLEKPSVLPIDLPEEEDAQELDGGRIVRRRGALTGELRLSADRIAGPYGGIRLRAEVHNTSAWADPAPTRNAALRGAFVAAHILFGIADGSFLSLLDPPEWAKPAAAACRNERMWPVLLTGADMVLAAPIILYDFPEIAPESPADLFDATEIDEILTLRTMALTDEEKREARATDERARELVDRVDAMPAELIERLHGTVRYLRAATTTELPEQPADPEQARETTAPWWDPGADASVSPETDAVDVRGVAVRKGSKVRLRQGSRRTDAQDMFLYGRIATVQAVLLDVDGERYVAVSLDDDPAADLQTSHGRFRYFFPDEIEPLP